MKTIKKLSLLLLASFVLWSCGNDDDAPIVIPTPQALNIVETAQATDALSSLVAAVIEADLAVTLSGSGPFTVLAPTNDAFAEFLDDNGWADVSEIPNDALAQVLLNHVISGTVTSTDLVGLGAGYTSTLADGPGGNKISLYFDASNGVRFNNISSVQTADVAASNGIVHIVDSVIYLPTVVDHALGNSAFSSLVSALGAADGNLIDVLDGAGPFTVLAPVNDAFATYLDGTPLGDVPTDQLSQLLLNHVIGGAFTSTDLAGLIRGYTNTGATGAGNPMSIYFDASNGVVFNGASTVAIADVVAVNGIIHAVDAVVALPTIATFATTNPALTSLVAALQLADTGTPTVPYITTVSDADAGPFTVFAPTDSAFADLLLELDPTGATALGDLAPATVDGVLTYHIVGANVQSSMLMTGTVATLGGDITADATAFTLTDPNGRVSNIVTSLVDIQATNGVVHVIDKVILPLQ